MILMFDTETTGKWDFKAHADAPQQPNLVQLAALLCDEGGLIRGQLNVIVTPDGWEISEEVAKIHGITADIAQTFGVPRKVALATFNHLCKAADKLVAHNLEFDEKVMLCQYSREKAPHRMAHMKKICTMRAATPVLKIPKPRGGSARDPYKWPTLTECYKHFFNGKTFDGAHNAMNDVLAMYDVFFKLRGAGHV